MVNMRVSSQNDKYMLVSSQNYSAVCEDACVVISCPLLSKPFLLFYLLCALSMSHRGYLHSTLQQSSSLSSFYFNTFCSCLTPTDKSFIGVALVFCVCGRKAITKKRMDEHQARTIKILQSLCVSHKIVETYRNQHAPKFSIGKMGMMHQWQHWPVLSRDVTPENRSEHRPSAMTIR
jgi:hypothetical protein